MAVRVTSEEVAQIIDYDTAAITDISPFITMANMMVNSRIGEGVLAEEVLKEIERWLAAHFVAIRDPRIKSESVDVISTSYQGQTGMGLQATLYGQQAMMLDTTGKLSKTKINIGSFSTIDYTTSATS